MNPTRILLFIAFFAGLFNIGLYITQDFGFKSSIITKEYNSNSSFVKIATGGQHTCAIAEYGGVWCWGQGGSGQLGTGHLTSSATPLPVINLPEQAIDIDVYGTTSCALLKSGEAWCWGSNNQGQLDIDSKNLVSTFPVKIKNIKNATLISMGLMHTCVALQEKGATCWGEMRHQDEEGRVFLSNSFEKRIYGENIKFIRLTSGYLHTCGISSKNETFCWGNSLNGEAGEKLFPKNNQKIINTAQKIPLSYKTKFLSAGAYHTCAVDTLNNTWCWGDSKGFSNKSEATFSPVKIFTNINPLEIVAGTETTCANTNSGHICQNTNQKNLYKTFPKEAPNLYHSTLKLDSLCGLDETGSAWCTNATSIDTLAGVNIRPVNWKPDNTFKTRWSRIAGFWIKQNIENIEEKDF